ncbi:hypothetical protein PsalN5692_00900 [Piscirickettsia salmonis]|uniref:hypothetical protein n=1 Tax=Piscirickettsia salmonis TaxID=1238 RepID=UPI0012B6EBFD|nr:hypothetical protein [Piscirickettsia salmonis]QGP49461.1 hypothetical protein PsalN5692_00900 [Piscirickettsia salmonis]
MFFTVSCFFDRYGVTSQLERAPGQIAALALSVKSKLHGFLSSDFNKNMKEGLKLPLVSSYNFYKKYNQDISIKSSFRMIFFYNLSFFFIMSQFNFIKNSINNDSENLKFILSCIGALANPMFKLSYGVSLGIVNLCAIAKYMYQHDILIENNLENEQSIKDYIKSMINVFAFSNISMYTQEYLQNKILNYFFGQDSLTTQMTSFVSSALLSGYLFIYLSLSYENSSPNHKLTQLSKANGFAWAVGSSYQALFTIFDRCLPRSLAFAMQNVLYEFYVFAVLLNSQVNYGERSINIFKPALLGQKYIAQLVKTIASYFANPKKEPRRLVQMILKLSARILNAFAQLVPKSPTIMNAPFYQLTTEYKKQILKGEGWMQWLSCWGAPQISLACLKLIYRLGINGSKPVKFLANIDEGDLKNVIDEFQNVAKNFKQQKDYLDLLGCKEKDINCIENDSDDHVIVESLEKNDTKLNKILLNWLLCIEDRPLQSWELVDDERVLQEDSLIDDYVMVDERCNGQLFHQHCHQHRSDNKNLNNSNMRCDLNIL